MANFAVRTPPVVAVSVTERPPNAAAYPRTTVVIGLRLLQGPLRHRQPWQQVLQGPQGNVSLPSDGQGGPATRLVSLYVGNVRGTGYSPSQPDPDVPVIDGDSSVHDRSPPSDGPGSRFQLLAIVAVTVLVMVLGVLVVVAPDKWAYRDRPPRRRRARQSMMSPARHLEIPALLGLASSMTSCWMVAASTQPSSTATCGIRTVNRLAGGQAVVLAHLPELTARIERGRPIEVLDLATGSGDIPSAVANWSAHNALPLRLTVSDVSAEILTTSRQYLAGVPNVTYAVWDARDVPQPDRSFDIVLLSLALHHFGPPDAIRVLREMQRLTRVGFIVNDIRRCVAGYAAAWTASRLATRNRITRHADRCRFSLTRRRELRALLQGAGVTSARVVTHPPLRMAAVYHRHNR